MNVPVSPFFTSATATGKLVFIGGGHANLVALKKLVTLLRKYGTSCQLTLVSPHEQSTYSGMLPGFLAGHYDYQDLCIDLPTWCSNNNIQFIRGEACKLDPGKKLVQIRASRKPGSTPVSLSYDLLSLNLGAAPDLVSVPGAAQQSLPVKPIQEFSYQWQGLLNLLSEYNHKQDIAIVGAGAAGTEIALAMAWRIQQEGFNAKIHLLDSESILAGYPSRTRQTITLWLTDAGVELHQGQKVTQVFPERMQLENNKELAFDHLLWCTGSRGSPWLANSDLPVDDKQFILTNEFLQVKNIPHVFAAGDCSVIESVPLPRAGVYAVRQGKLLAENLFAAIHGSPLHRFQPQPAFLSIITGGSQKAAASRGAWLQFSGRWVWYMKDRIDRGFIQQFKDR